MAEVKENPDWLMACGVIMQDIYDLELKVKSLGQEVAPPILADLKNVKEKLLAGYAKLKENWASYYEETEQA